MKNRILENQIKMFFKLYFNGFYYEDGFNDVDIKPIVNIPLNKFEIHKIEIKKKLFKNYISIKLFLGKPGIFIGYCDEQRKTFEKALSESTKKEVKIFVKEFDPFKTKY